jgi:hypothetical protein
MAMARPVVDIGVCGEFGIVVWSSGAVEAVVSVCHLGFVEEADGGLGGEGWG